MFLEFTYIRLNVEFGNMKQANTTFPFFTALVNGRGHSYTHIRQQKPRLCRRSSSRGRWSRRSSSNNNTYCSLLSTKKVNFIQFSLESWVFFSSKFRKYILLWLPWCRCIICFVLTDEVQQKYLIMVTQSVNKGAPCALRSIKWGCFQYKYIHYTSTSNLQWTLFLGHNILYPVCSLDSRAKSNMRLSVTIRFIMDIIARIS